MLDPTHPHSGRGGVLATCALPAFPIRIVRLVAAAGYAALGLKGSGVPTTTDKYSSTTALKVHLYFYFLFSTYQHLGSQNDSNYDTYYDTTRHYRTRLN